MLEGKILANNRSTRTDVVLVDSKSKWNKLKAYSNDSGPHEAQDVVKEANAPMEGTFFSN